MALGTWLPDPEANNQLQKAYASTAGLDMSDSDRRNAAHKLVGNSKFTKQSKRSKDGAKDKYLSYPVARTSDEKTGDTLRIKCVEYVPPPESGFGVGVKGVFKETGSGDKKKVVAATKEDRLAAGMENGQMQLTTDFTDANSRISDPQNTKTKYYIELPIPQEVNDSNSVTWGEDRMNAIELATLSIAQRAMETGVGDVGTLAQAGIQAFNEGVNIPGLNSETQSSLRAAISGYALNALGSQVSSKSVISRSTGQILNNNLELLFSGVNLRSFPFTFTFSPRNPKESDVVKAIIRSLKMSMAAKAGEFNGSAQGIFLKSPDLFQLDYLKDGKNHPFLNRFKLCALTGMSVNYTNAGTYASYSDGTPVNIRMNCTFKEINPIYHEDYIEGVSGDGVGF
tara:strand:+ start:55 stop:1245 length:1191 start_codon:yes stop_codon:yes gene_type:complete